MAQVVLIMLLLFNFSISWIISFCFSLGFINSTIQIKLFSRFSLFDITAQYLQQIRFNILRGSITLMSLYYGQNSYISLHNFDVPSLLTQSSILQLTSSILSFICRYPLTSTNLLSRSYLPTLLIQQTFPCALSYRSKQTCRDILHSTQISPFEISVWFGISSSNKPSILILIRLHLFDSQANQETTWSFILDSL